MARAVLRASLRGKQEIVVPASNWGFVWLHTLFPRLMDRAMVWYLRRNMRMV